MSFRLLSVLILALGLVLCSAEDNKQSSTINLSTDPEFLITKLAPEANAGFGFSISVHTDSNAKKRLLVSAPYADIPAPSDLIFSSRYGQPTRPGAVFSCSVSGAQDCTALSYRFETKDGVVNANGSSMLLGHTVSSASNRAMGFRQADSSSSSSNGRHSVSCAHLLKTSSAGELPVGSCVVWDSDFKPTALNNKLYNVGQYDIRNMFGFSSDSYGSSDSDVFVFGMPGHAMVYHRATNYSALDQGGVAIEVIQGQQVTEHRVLGFSPTELEGYAGYSIALSDIFAGDDQNLITIVIGAPRAGNLTGRVFFVNFNPKTNQDSRLNDRTLAGDGLAPMGSQFGYSVLPVDFNGDGFVDLLVSAPFAFEKDHEQYGGFFQSSSLTASTGTVFAYLSLPAEDGSRSLTTIEPVALKPPQCSSNGHLSAFCSSRDNMFGLSMASPGDIDGDGVHDVAIGAPGENNGKGAVYLYRGSSSGLSLVSRLEPKGAGDRFFGFSLVGGNVDIDENGYPDLAVGSFGADRVWILRSKPVIRIQPSLTNATGARFLPLDSTQATTFKICFALSSPAPLLKQSAPLTYLNLSVVIDLDTNRERSRRLFFADKTSTMVRNLSLGATPRNPWSLTTCIDGIQVFAGPAVVDPITPVNVALTIGSQVRVSPLGSLLMNVPADGQLIPIEPIVHPDSLTHNWQVEFERNCGPDFVCISDLVLKTEFADATEEGITSTGDGQFDYVRATDKTETVTLTVKVENKGETAYDSRLYVFFSPGLSFRSTPAADLITCDPPQQVSPAPSTTKSKLAPAQSNARVDFVLVCRPSVAAKGIAAGSVSFELVFGVTRWLSLNEHFTLHVNSSSTERDPADNKAAIQLNVYSASKLMLSAASRPEQLNYSASANVVSEKLLYFLDEAGPALEHVFVVENDGPAAVRGLALHLAWPAYFDCPDSKQDCEKLLYLAEEVTVTGGGGGTCATSGSVNAANLAQRPEQLLKRSRRQALIVDDKEAIKNECQSNPRLRDLQNRVRCETSRCRINRLERHQRARVSLRFRVWQSTLVKNFGSSPLLVFSSLARLQGTDGVRLIQGSVLETSASSEVYAINVAVASTILPPWAIAVLSVAIGILIVLLILLILYCLGFFKRKQRPKSQVAQVESFKNYPYDPVAQQEAFEYENSQM